VGILQLDESEPFKEREYAEFANGFHPNIAKMHIFGESPQPRRHGEGGKGESLLLLLVLQNLSARTEQGFISIQKR
jgi:hypothetical protein